MKLVVKCLCEPPKDLIAYEGMKSECTDCGMGIVAGHLETARPELRLVRESDARTDA